MLFGFSFFLSSSFFFFFFAFFSAFFAFFSAFRFRRRLFAELDSEEDDEDTLADFPSCDGRAPLAAAFAKADTASIAPTDACAVAAAALAAGLDPSAAGEVTTEWLRYELPDAEVDDDGAIQTSVLYADSFGNLITTVGAGLLAGGAWTVEAGGESMPLVGTYAEVEVGALLALVGSSGTVEVSLRDGDAAARLGVGAGASVVIRPQA